MTRPDIEELYLEEAVQVIHMAVDGKDTVSGWPLGHIKIRVAKLKEHLPSLFKYIEELEKENARLCDGLSQIAVYAGDCKREVHASYYYIEQMANDLRLGEASDD